MLVLFFSCNKIYTKRLLVQGMIQPAPHLPNLTDNTKKKMFPTTGETKRVTVKTDTSAFKKK